MKNFDVTQEDMRDGYDKLCDRVKFYDDLNRSPSRTVESVAIQNHLMKLRDLWWASLEELALINIHEGNLEAS
jgi:hypothetical protein